MLSKFSVYSLVFEGPVSRLEKDQDWKKTKTGPDQDWKRPGPDKTKTTKDRKETVFDRPVFVVKTGLNW